MNEDWWNENWYRLLEINIGCIMLASPILFLSYYLMPIIFFVLLIIFSIIIGCTIITFIIHREAKHIRRLHDELDMIDRAIELKERGIIP